MIPEDDSTVYKPIHDATIRKPGFYTTRLAEPLELLGDIPEAQNKFSGDYSLRGSVGEGGVGRVLLGFDERIGREVAIKELLDQAAHQDADLSTRFLREARITGRLEHPGIVPVYDLGVKENGAPYYVMRLVRGDTLAKKLHECNSSALPEQALSQRLSLLDRLIDVCEAMAYAHSKGVIHRDIKPGNIVLGAFGETIILDWGLAKVENEAEIAVDHVSEQTRQGDNAELTRIGDILGTPAYMAPEQADSRFGTVDARSDVFALGCILYFLLTGQPPLQGTADQILEQLISSAPLPSSRKPKLPLPPELTAICDKAINKDPLKRFPDAGALAEELIAYRDGRLVSTYAYSPAELLRRFMARNKIAVLTAAAVLFAIVIGGGLALKFGIEAQQARELAVAEGDKVKLEKQRAERALADVTRISNDNLTIADHVATVIRNSMDEIRIGMEQTAADLRTVKDSPKLQGLLDGLALRYSRPESFAATRAPGVIVAVAPIKYRQAIGADTAQLEHNILVREQGIPILSRVYEAPEGFEAITLVIPVKQGKTITGFISCRLKAAEFLGGLLTQSTQTETRTVWVVQDDGLILYDSNPAEIGRNLFREERFMQIPELRQLAGQIAQQDGGVGYYQNQKIERSEATHRIASWETVRPTQNRAWKVVVLEEW